MSTDPTSIKSFIADPCIGRWFKHKRYAVYAYLLRRHTNHYAVIRFVRNGNILSPSAVTVHSMDNNYEAKEPLLSSETIERLRVMLRRSGHA